MAYNFTITQKEYDFVLQACQSLLGQYCAQEIDCQLCKQMYPLNSNINEVKKKVQVLNSYYSTRVPVDTMATNIVNLSKKRNLDQNLGNGVLSVVHDIAKDNRDYFSFATKYCALLQPTLYPIIDKYVWAFFRKLRQLGFFEKATNKKFANVNKYGSNAYSDYVDIYNEFIDKSGIRFFFSSYREVDAYIWGACRMYLLLNTTSKHTGKQYIQTWLGTFSASLLANLLSSAIWAILSQIKF